MARTVLLVDYFFPPLGGPGVQRTLGYVRNLPRDRWNPVVLTVADGEHHIVDESLNEHVPVDVEVVRARSIEPIRFAKRTLAAMKRPGPAPQTASGQPFWQGSRRLRKAEYWLLFPDRRIGWLPSALSRGLALGRRRAVDVIYSSSTNIMTGHLVGYLLKRFLRRPWVADFQDAWLEDYVSTFPSKIHRMAAERLERLVVRQADRITVATDQHAELLRDHYGATVGMKTVVVPMGFDPNAFEDLHVDPTEKFVISHFGSFYSTRSPSVFLRAVGEAGRVEPSFVEDLEIRFLGTFDVPGLRATEELTGQHSLERAVHRLGVLPYRTALGHLVSSAVLLLITDEGVWGRRLLASKVMEYLACGRTILALAPSGPTADLVQRTNAGVVVAPSDVMGIRDAILSLYADWKSGRLMFRGNAAIISSLSWPNIARAFADVLDSARIASMGRQAS
jgi:glycosyltransferase involved in cell wall biosynthesis